MFKDIWVSYIWYNLERMHALYSKVVLVFNFPTVVLNLIMTIFPEMQLQSHGIFQIKIFAMVHFQNDFCEFQS